MEEWLRDEFFEQHSKLFHHRPFVWHIWDGRKDGFHALVNYHQLDHAALQKLTYSYKATGQVVLVSHWRGSPGGWLKRVTGWGSHAPYQCGKKTLYPHESAWIKF